MKEGYSIVSVPSTVWSLSDGSKFKDALNEFEDRLSQGKFLSPDKSLVTLRGDGGSITGTVRRTCSTSSRRRQRLGWKEEEGKTCTKKVVSSSK